MSEIVHNLKLGEAVFPTSIVTLDKKVRVDDPANPGKKKSETRKVDFIFPDITSTGAILSLISALVSAADAAQAGNGLALAKTFVQERLEDATEAALNRTTGDFDEKAYAAFLLSPERPRSAGQSIKQLDGELAELSTELVSLVPHANSPDGWANIKDAAGNAVYSGQTQFLLRLTEVCNKIKDLNRQIAARHEAAAQKKASAAAKAEAAAKLAAAPATQA